MTSDYMAIPVSEFERLHTETKTLEALAVQNAEEIERLRAEIHQHDPTACRQCSGHPLDA